MANEIIIYPQWARFTFAWSELPSIMVRPDEWLLPGRTSVKHLRSLGYTVTASDHSFLSGPRGGGLIGLNRGSQWWFPKVLFLSESTFEPPPGFGRAKPCPISVLVPRIAPEHKLGLEEMPAAPSALFSIETVSSPTDYCVIAVGCGSRDQRGFEELLRMWGLQLESVLDPPRSCADIFSTIESNALYYLWYQIKAESNHFWKLVSQIVYTGLAIKNDGRVLASRVHVFASSLMTSGCEFSASRWQKKTRLRRTAADW